MIAEGEIKNLMQTAMNSIREMIDVNTVVGELMQAGNGTSIIPLSKVSCGFFAGGGEYGCCDKCEPDAPDYPFAGGSGGGVSLQPLGFLVVNDEQIRIIGVEGGGGVERLLDAAPLFLDTLRELIEKNKKPEQPPLKQN